MFGAISADIMMDLASKMGIYTQLELDIPRHYIIEEEYLTDIPVSFYHLNGKGQKTGSMSSQDHPAFAALRDHLEATGRIKTSRNSSNGDITLKPFYLNDYYFDEGERFPCAAALGNSFRFINKNNEDVARESSKEERTV